MDGQHEQPRVTASFSLHPDVHSFSTSPSAPSLSLTMTSHHTFPITIYADDASPQLMLRCGALTMTDIGTGEAVKQSIRTHCRIPPPSKVNVTISEDRFYTLQPEQPVTFSATFSQIGGRTALPGRQRKFGVDGLEAGKRYKVGLSGTPRVQWNRIRWWEYGTKEEVLDKGYDARRVVYMPGPHPAIIVDVSGIEEIELECEE